MSKSYGNVIDPFELVQEFPLEVVKGYMLAFGPSLKDSNFETEEMVIFYNNYVNTVRKISTLIG